MIIRHHARHVTAPLCLAALWAVAGHGQRHSLTPADIAQAIEWGQSGRPEAYPLRSAFPRNKTTPGVVYTPYLRVALAARAAREEERGFTAEDVTSEMTAPFIYFAIGEVGEDPRPPGPLLADTPVSMRLITDHSRAGSSDRREISPVWIRREVPALSPSTRTEIGEPLTVNSQLTGEAANPNRRGDRQADAGGVFFRATER